MCHRIRSLTFKRHLSFGEQNKHMFCNNNVSMCGWIPTWLPWHKQPQMVRKNNLTQRSLHLIQYDQCLLSFVLIRLYDLSWWIHAIHITMTSQWAWWRLRSPASRLFTQPFIRVRIKENIKPPRYWPLCGEFTRTGEFSAQMASNAENVKSPQPFSKMASDQ